MRLIPSLRRVAVLVIGSTLASLVVASAAPAQAAPAGPIPAFGVQAHLMWGDYTDAQRLEALDRLAAAHVEWVRIDMGWSSFQETSSTTFSQWYINRANLVVDAARARGLKVLVTAWRVPSWANGGAGVYAPPTDPADFGRFCGWLATHFKGRVEAYEIWNEPNLSSFYTGTVEQYVGMLKAAYPAIKAADPAAQVVLGAPAYNDTNWLGAVYGAGAQGSFDVMGTHPYLAPSDLPPETPDTKGTNIWLLTHVTAVHNMMVAYGDGAKPIWFTEFGWSNHANTGTEYNWQKGVTLEQQADYLLRTLTFVGATYPYVTHVFWYNERDRVSGNVQVDNYGLMYRDLTPKPVYLALQSFLAPAAAPVDTTAPSAPTVVTATALDPARVEVGWTASTDDVDVAGYDLFRDGVLLASVAGTAVSYTDASVTPSTTYGYAVEAVDAAGNRSARTAAPTVSTPAPPQQADVIAPTISGLSVSPQPMVKSCTITFAVDEAAVIRVRILAADGALVKTLIKDTSFAAGQISVRWGRRDRNGNRVPAGTYTVAVTATDVAGNVGSATRSFVAV